MKLSFSTITIVGTTLAAVAVFSVEGFSSLVNKYDLEQRISNLEQANQDLIVNQNYLFELLNTFGSSPQTGAGAIQVERTGRTVTHEDLDLFCLAKNIFHEASVETELGMFAVAQVTINRVRNANYPNTICDVVMQPAQFSWANNKSRRWTHPSGPQWETAKRIARQVIKEGYRVPALQAAVFYHADYVNPQWRDPSSVIAQVGTHIFYERAK
jgi:N-acetylmuramoyl-L-alanine amidase